eukprot:6211970-Pleurochrysis_carterae.AAC.11
MASHLSCGRTFDDYPFYPLCSNRAGGSNFTGLVLVRNKLGDCGYGRGHGWSNRTRRAVTTAALAELDAQAVRGGPAAALAGRDSRSCATGAARGRGRRCRGTSLVRAGFSIWDVTLSPQGAR